jgi:hypothetical protein
LIAEGHDPEYALLIDSWLVINWLLTDKTRSELYWFPACRTLGENPRKGSSLAAIKGCMAEEWGVDIRQLAAKIKIFILNAVQDGEIIQTKGNVVDVFDGS